MFERLILDYVNPLISTYMPHIDRDQFALNLLSGQLTLENLQLKVDSLNHLIGIPLHIDSISIARLHAGVNWTRLFSNPITVQIEGIRIVARDKTEVDWDEKMLFDTIQGIKMAMLESIEKSELSNEENGSITATNDNEGSKSSIALMKLIFAAAKNLILEIKDIHLSYVHFKGNGYQEPNVVFENEIECVTGLGIERIILNNGEDNMQVLKFQNVFLYCNTDPCQFQVPSRDCHGSSFSAVSPNVESIQSHASQPNRIDPSIAAAQSAPADLNVIRGEGAAKTIQNLLKRAPICSLSIQSILTEYQNQFGFVLEPFTLDLGMKLGAVTRPANVVSIRLHTDIGLEITLYEKQLISIMKMFNHISRVGQRQNQVMEAMQRTRFRCATNREQSRYIDLYSRTLNADWLQDLSKEEKKEKDEFERDLSLADLTILRKATVAEIQAQKGVAGIGAKAELASNQPQNQSDRSDSESSTPSVVHRTKTKSSWWSRLWGSSNEEDEKAPVYLSQTEKQSILESITKEYEDSQTSEQSSPISPAKMGTEPKASATSDLVSSIPILPPTSLPFHIHFELTLCIPKISAGIFSGSGIASSSRSSSYSTHTRATDTLTTTTTIPTRSDLTTGTRIVIAPTAPAASRTSGSSISAIDRVGGSSMSTTRTDTDTDADVSESSGISSRRSSFSSSASTGTDDSILRDQLIQFYLCGAHLCFSLMTYEQKCLVDFAVTSIEMHDMSTDGENESIGEMDSEMVELDKAYRQILLISPSVNPISTDSPLAGTNQNDPVSTPAGSGSGIHHGTSGSIQSGIGSGSQSAKSARISKTSAPQVQKPIRITFATPQKNSPTEENKNKSDRDGMNLLDIQLMNIRFQFNPVLNRLAAIFGHASQPSIQPPSSASGKSIVIGSVKEADKTAAGLPAHRHVNIFDDVAFNELLSTPPGRTMCSHLFPPVESLLTFLLSLASPVDLRLRMFHPLIQIMMKPNQIKATQNQNQNLATAAEKSSISSLSVPAFIFEWSIKGDGEIDRDRQYVGLNASINNLHCFATTLSSDNATLDHQKKLNSNLESPHQHCLIEPVGITFAYQQHQQTHKGLEKKMGMQIPSVEVSHTSSTRLSDSVANVLSPPLFPVSKQVHVELRPLNVRLNSSLAELMLQMMESGATENPMVQSALKAGLTFLSTRGRI